MAIKAKDKLYVEQHDGTIFDIDGEINEFQINLIPQSEKHPCHVEISLKLDNIKVKNATVKNVVIVKDGVVLSMEKEREMKWLYAQMILKNNMQQEVE